MITVTSLEQIGQDERGETHVFDTDRSGQLIVIYRKAGSIGGRHYHKGVAPGKNPEILILMKGVVEINWKRVPGGPAHVPGGAGTEGSSVSAENGSVSVTGPARIVIPAYIWHEVIALTDFVMLEMNSAAAGKTDTIADPRIDA